ncbi:MAG TPA: SDR family oxidoreductase [Bacteriovoracaceae bacterium]|nr:SDR family oxidoreductase [Bacteriovoracaceae bacterium]
MKKYPGKVAVVTGGTRGIGRAISLDLARAGATVFALYGRDRQSADELSQEASKEGLKIHTIRGDLTHPEKFKETIDQIKAQATQVDFVVHCAASGVHKEAIDLSLKHMKWTFDINVFAVHQLLQELVPLMPSGGRVIGITSSGGTRVIPYYAAVGSSKGALESLFRHYAHEWAPKGIAVNCVCPGLVLTDAVEAFPDKENRTKKSVDATPSGRLSTPEDVAGLVNFLCSEFAGQIIGQTIAIDGGKTLLS